MEDITSVIPRRINVGVGPGSGSLQVVGLGMKRHEVGLPDEAPSRPLSRTSRAESMGSLADFSQHASYQLPSELEHSSRHRQHTENYRARAERKHVGGGGMLLHGKSSLSACPPLMSVTSSNNRHQPQGWPYMVIYLIYNSNFFLHWAVLDEHRVRASAEMQLCLHSVELKVFRKLTVVQQIFSA